MALVETKFEIGDDVFIDNDRDMKVRVLGVLWRRKSVEIECGWMHNGQANSAWFADWRLTRHTAKTPMITPKQAVITQWQNWFVCWLTGQMSNQQLELHFAKSPDFQKWFESERSRIHGGV